MSDAMLGMHDCGFDGCGFPDGHAGPHEPELRPPAALPVRSEPQAPGDEAHSRKAKTLLQTIDDLVRERDFAREVARDAIANRDTARAQRDAYQKALSEIAEHTYDAPSDEWAVIKTRGIALAALARRSGETPT